jgi:hypothetical protein
VTQFAERNRPVYNFIAMSKYEIAMRIKVLDPPADTTMNVQRGRDELLAPVKVSNKELVFDFSLSVDFSSDEPNFLGKFAQGPKKARFVYVNSGTYAGQTDSCWSRRAKISLMGITAAQVREVLKNPGSGLEIRFKGTGGRDGGPVCGSIRFNDDGWKVVKW